MKSRLSKIFAIILSIPLAALIFGGSDKTAEGADSSNAITRTL